MKIIHDRSKCIGCGACVNICSKYFEMSENGKACLKNAKELGGEKYELEVEDVGCAQEAADSCPGGCIHIE